MQRGGQPTSPILPAPKKPSWWLMGIIVVAAALFALGIWWLTDIMVQQSVQELDDSSVASKSKQIPELTTDTVVKNRDHVWEIGFLPTGQMLFTERKGTLSIVEGGNVRTLVSVPDIYAKGEGGLLGFAVDTSFASNHYIYTCFNSTKGGPDIRVARWKVKDDLSGLQDRLDIVTGITSNPTGRHSGCRVAMGQDGSLWIGTGDSGMPGVSPQRPQDPKSLNGKILRVDRDGKAVAGNMGGNFDSRIFNYGHRNIQGLAFFAAPQDGVPGVSVEHGSTVDDEINPLKPGNFGWDPDKAYSELNVPMTDTVKFPDAIKPIWSSGNPTQAPSGAAFLRGNQWKAWSGSLAVAFLKDQKLKIVDINAANNLVKQQDVLVKQFGRLRAAALGPDGNLYLSTDNGNNADQIIRVTPR